MKSKKSFEMSFSWIFAFIAGGAILLLALYGMSKVIQTGQNLGQTEAAAALTALLDPLETGLASQKSEEIKLNADTAIFFTCSYLDNRPFGKQMIAFSEKNLNNKPGEKGRDISIKNKYIFSESVINGKNLYAFSVPFFLPFKIGDLIITKDLKNCSGTMVCFDSERDECDVKVFSNGGNYNNGKIVKNLQEVKYRDGLIYGAIFSSKEIYECNVKRLMARLSELTLIYSDKADTLNKKGCSSDIKLDLNVLKNNANSANSSRDLIDLDESAKKVDSFNKGIMQRCKLY